MTKNCSRRTHCSIWTYGAYHFSLRFNLTFNHTITWYTNHFRWRKLSIRIYFFLFFESRSSVLSRMRVEWTEMNTYLNCVLCVVSLSSCHLICVCACGSWLIWLIFMEQCTVMQINANLRWLIPVWMKSLEDKQKRSCRLSSMLNDSIIFSQKYLMNWT